MMKQVNRLRYLADLMGTYRDAYHRGMNNGRGLSNRLQSWIDEYDEMRHTPAWDEYCRRDRLAKYHDSSDLFA